MKGTSRIKSAQATLSLPCEDSFVRQSTRTQSQKIVARTAIPCPPFRRRGSNFHIGMTNINISFCINSFYTVEYKTEPCGCRNWIWLATFLKDLYNAGGRLLCLLYKNCLLYKSE